MNWHIGFFVSYFITTVYAGGYQGCLERVWLYQAYELEALIPVSSRILGYGCPGAAWDDVTKRCTVAYVPCKSDANLRCTYEELMNHMKTGRDAARWTQAHRVMNNGRIDARGTAMKCVERYAPRRGGVRNFPAWQMMKAESRRTPGEHVHNYNEYTERLGTQIDYVHRRVSASNQYLFDEIDTTRNQIDIARAGDHGRFLIAEARRRITGITIKTKDLGPNPVGTTNWQTVDWQQTIVDAMAAGNANVKRDVKNFIRNFYHGTNDEDKPARQHYQMFRAYRVVADRSYSCRGRP